MIRRIEKLLASFNPALAPLHLVRAAKWIAIVAAIVSLIFALRSCGGGREEVEQARQDTRSAEALAETAMEAAETAIERAGEEASIDDLVEAAAMEIDNAPTDEAAADAARAAICELLPDSCRSTAP